MRVQPFQSLTYTWAASKTFPIDLSFLNATRDMAAPVIDELVIVSVMAITTGSAGLRGGALASMYSQVLVQDQAGERVNVRGSSLRVIDQLEYGSGFQDVTSIAATQTTNQSRTLVLRVPFNPEKARRRRDFGLPIRGFLDGGKMQLVTSAALIPGMGANGGTIQSGTITVYAWVRDERVPEAKSRLCYLDESIAQTNFDYNVAGSLRYALWYNGEINEATPTAWSAQQLTSKTLELQLINDYVFQDKYATYQKPPRSSPGTVATADTYAQTDCVLTGQAVPIYFPNQEEKIPDMPQMQTLNIRTSLSSITTSDLPQVIKSVVTERSTNVTARVLGVSDPAAAVASSGRIKAASNDDLGVASFPPQIAKMMPIKLRKGR
jgi:hypothetical protein